MASPDQGHRWGILGGAFDPIHNGHLQLARDCADLRQFQKILFVPSFTPPLKPAGCDAAFADRCAMVELAIRGEPHFELSRLEEEIGGAGYTLTLVREFKKRYPRIDFFFIIGADNIPQLRHWHQPEALAAEVTIVAGSRPGYRLEKEDLPDGVSVDLVETTAVDVSATEVRAALNRRARADRVAAMLPPAVLEFITKRDLYSHG